MTEPNTQTTEAAEFDAKLESELDAYEGRQETPEDGSSSKETQDTETEDTKDAGADQPKKAESEVPKEDESLKDIDPKDKAFREKWNKAKENLATEHKKEIESLRSDMPSKEEVETFRSVTSSPAYVRETMRAQGYKDEAIDGKLKELGHNVPTRETDDVGLVTRELGLDPKSVTDDQRQYISDITKVSRVMMRHMMGQELPGQLKPFKEGMEEIQRERGSSQVSSMIQKTIKDEGVLDYEKDIAPEMNKWLDENEGKQGATQDDFINHFHKVNHQLSIERLRTGKRREDRDKAKGNQRPGKGDLGPATRKMPDKTGDWNKDVDSALDALGIMT